MSLKIDCPSIGNCLIFYFIFIFFVLQGTPGSSCVYLLPHPGTSCFSKEPWLLLLRNKISCQDLNAVCAHCYWELLLLRSCTQQSKKIHVCTTHVHRCTCVCTGVHLHIKLNMSLSCVPDVANSSIAAWVPCCSVTSHPTVTKLTLAWSPFPPVSPLRGGR